MTSSHALHLLALTSALAGCNTTETVSLRRTGDMELVSTTAGNNMSVVERQGTARSICPRLGPDAVTDRSFDLGFGSSQGRGAEDMGSQEAELEGRTPAILRTRDTLFQLCVMHQNGFISNQTFQRLMEKYLDAGFALARVEAEHTEITILEAPLTPLAPQARPTPLPAPAPLAPAPAPAQAPAGAPTATQPY